MKDYDPQLKLDFVLSIIVDNPFGIEYHTIQRTLDEVEDNLSRKLYLADLPLILQKLEDDGLIKFTKNPLVHFSGKPTGWLEQYRPTYKGKIFELEGGYTQEFISRGRTAKQKRLREWLMIGGTWAAGIGALSVIAFEIWKRYHQQC